MHLLLILLILFPTLAFPSTQDLVIQEATKYVGIKETSDNRGPEVDKILKNVGLTPGNSWCMALVYTIYNNVYTNLSQKTPLLKTGKCSAFYNNAKTNSLKFKIISSDQVLLGSKLEAADIPIWQRGSIDSKGEFLGHTGILISQLDKKSFKSIEGNTSISDVGSQSNGDGCSYKVRKLGINNFKVLGFVRVR